MASSRHRRLQRSMRSPVRAARRAKKLHRQAKFTDGRPQADVSQRLSLDWLRSVWGRRES
jgi:hypothetical protein